jgi:hypothetical protein
LVFFVRKASKKRHVRRLTRCLERTIGESVPPKKKYLIVTEREAHRLRGGGYTVHRCFGLLLPIMLRDLWRYLKSVGMHWCTWFGLFTTIPEIFKQFFPNSFASLDSTLNRYVSPGTAAAVAFGLGIVGLVGLFFAGFLVWREAYRDIGLRAQTIG